MQKYPRAEQRDIDEHTVPPKSLTILEWALKVTTRVVQIALRVGINRRRCEEHGCGPGRSTWPIVECRNPLQGMARARRFAE